MTTKVIVDAHAGWPVRVVLTDVYGDRDATETLEIVPPGEKREFYITSSRSIAAHEMRKDEAVTT